MRRRAVLGFLGALAISLLSLWARSEEVSRAVANIATSESLVAASATEYSYVVQVDNQNPQPVSVIIRPRAEATVGMSVFTWEHSPGLRTEVMQNIMTGENWSIKAELEPHQSGTLTLHIRVAAPLASPRVQTRPVFSRWRATKEWEFCLIDGQ